MEPIRIRCRSCGKEVIGVSGKSVCCGCSNMTTIYNDRIYAKNMDKVIMMSNYSNPKSKRLFTGDELEWQEKRNQRRVRKLDFEVR